MLILTRFRIGIAAAAAAICLQTGPVHAESAVTAVRIGDHGTKTRFVIELTRKVSFKAYTIANPYRAIIDLPEVAWALNKARASKGGVITGYRYGLFRAGNSRVVIDLKGPAKVRSSFAIPPRQGRGFRIVVDLAPVSAATFAAAKRPPQTASKPASRTAPRKAAPPKTASARTVPRGASTVSPKAPPPKATQTVRPAPPPANSRPPVRTASRPAPPPVRRTPTVSRPPAPVPKPRPNLWTVAIDPGHGGVDPGARGRAGTREKHLVLAYARELRRQLLATGRYKVVLTRDRDVFVRLRQRIAIAREAGADLFVSLHADSHRNRAIRGTSVYTLSERASDKEAEALATKENKADLIAGVDLDNRNSDVINILIDLAQRETMNESARFARLLIPELGKTSPLLRNTHRFAGFAVLKAPDVPSVLVELGYLSNPEQERILLRKSHRRGVARAVVRAVNAYFARQEAYNRP